jgi:hypothetical protein
VADAHRRPIMQIIRNFIKDSILYINAQLQTMPLHEILIACILAQSKDFIVPDEEERR